MPGGTGAMRERLVIQTTAPESVRLTALTSSGTTATATAAKAHGFVTGDYVTVAGASPAGYNGRVQVTVTGASAFTYTVSAGLTTPATGSVTVTYYSDESGGQRERWRTVCSVFGELIPLRASETLQAAAIQSTLEVRFRVHVQTGIDASMQVVWTPSFPPFSSARTLGILGVTPMGDGRQFMLLECGQRRAV